MELKLKKALEDILKEISCDGELYVEIELAIRRKAKLKKAIKNAHLLLKTSYFI